MKLMKLLSLLLLMFCALISCKTKDNNDRQTEKTMVVYPNSESLITHSRVCEGLTRNLSKNIFPFYSDTSMQQPLILETIGQQVVIQVPSRNRPGEFRDSTVYFVPSHSDFTKFEYEGVYKSDELISIKSVKVYGLSKSRDANNEEQLLFVIHPDDIDKIDGLESLLKTKQVSRRKHPIKVIEQNKTAVDVLIDGLNQGDLLAYHDNKFKYLVARNDIHSYTKRIDNMGEGMGYTKKVYNLELGKTFYAIKKELFPIEPDLTKGFDVECLVFPIEFFNEQKDKEFRVRKNIYVRPLDAKLLIGEAEFNDLLTISTAKAVVYPEIGKTFKRYVSSLNSDDSKVGQEIIRLAKESDKVVFIDSNCVNDSIAIVLQQEEIKQITINGVTKDTVVHRWINPKHFTKLVTDYSIDKIGNETLVSIKVYGNLLVDGVVFGEIDLVWLHTSVVEKSEIIKQALQQNFKYRETKKISSYSLQRNVLVKLIEGYCKGNFPVYADSTYSTEIDFSNTLGHSCADLNYTFLKSSNFEFTALIEHDFKYELIQDYFHEDLIGIKLANTKMGAIWINKEAINNLLTNTEKEMLIKKKFNIPQRGSLVQFGNTFMMTEL